ncbi:MAG TPA: DinB family protein [Puia sp.]|nr:DinB family protein [Puia sp.]
MLNQQQLIVKQILDAWNTQIARTDKFFKEHSDEQLQKEIAPDRNSGAYLLGHLTTVHDALFPMFGIGERLYPELENIFLENPDKSGLKKPSVEYLRNCWKTVNEKLAQHFNAYSVDEWLERHSAVKEEDFKKEPNRNKLNVVINRTNHLANHLGQLMLLKD